MPQIVEPIEKKDKAVDFVCQSPLAIAELLGEGRSGHCGYDKNHSGFEMTIDVIVDMVMK